ncbi:MAG: hypothetical protein ACE1ZJ_00065, partial [Nitrospirales bacterium]
VAVDARGKVFIVDSGNMRLQQFVAAEEAEEHLLEGTETLTALPESLQK